MSGTPLWVSEATLGRHRTPFGLGAESNSFLQPGPIFIPAFVEFAKTAADISCMGYSFAGAQYLVASAVFIPS